MKKTAVDRFADSHEGETRCLDLNWKMEHKEKMMLMHLKKCKYELQYGNTATVRATPWNIPKWASCRLYKNSGSGEMRLMG